MSKPYSLATPIINYIGDNCHLTKSRVKEAANIVISNYWKLSLHPPERYILDINVVSDCEIKKLNKKYLQRNYPTDVIAFALEEGEYTPDDEIPIIGQIVISKDAAKRQAEDYNHFIKDEMIILLIHGLLHIAGWKEGREIQKCQEKIKNQLSY